MNIIQSSPIIDYYGQETFHQTSSSRHIPIYNNQIYQDNNLNHFYRYNQASVYTCQNGLHTNYSEDNGLSDMVPSMSSIDLYGLSVTPPTTEVVQTIETIPKQDQDSPVIYPWMRKVHINNPG
jgi:hypothetical protein